MSKLLIRDNHIFRSEEKPRSRFIEGEDRSQATLFPESLDEYIAEDSAVRVIDVFIDDLDISGLGFKAEPSTTGRLTPYFKTIADFRKDRGEDRDTQGGFASPRWQRRSGRQYYHRRPAVGNPAMRSPDAVHARSIALNTGTAIPLIALFMLAGCHRTGNLEEEAAGMAALNPPPRASERSLGVHIEPCDLGTPLGAGEIEGESYYCGVFTVPQDWNVPDGARIDLGFAVAKATGDSPAPDPLMFLAGGPGQSAIATALTPYAGVRPGRDIVRMDQRGAGTSQRLGLEECLILALQDKSAEEDVEVLLQAMAAADPSGDAAVDSDSASSSDAVKLTVDRLCWNQFTAQGLELDTFNTSQSARDVLELLKALDYEVFNLHGTSYGTRLALTIMRELDRVDGAPELRAVVLDSPFPPSELLLSSMPHNLHDPVIQLFEECRSDPVCAAAYPDLQTRFEALLARLASDPIASGTDRIGPAELVRTVADLRGTRAGYMPRMISELEIGNLQTYQALVRRELGSELPGSGGGLDVADPVQGYLAAVMTALGSDGEIAAGIQFVAGFSAAVRQEEPIRALDRFIRDEYSGGKLERLLELTAELEPEDIDASPMVAQLRAEGENPQSPEDRKEAQERANRLLAIIDVATFLNKNIHCAEDLRFETLDDGLAAIDALEIPQLANRDVLVEQAARCEGWPVQAQPLSVKDPIVSDVPTLILQGAYDTRTPVFMGREAARQLHRSTLALVPQQGHEVWTNSTDCAAKIATAFILDPTRRLDLSCLAARKPRWALPEDAAQRGTSDPAATSN